MGSSEIVIDVFIVYLVFDFLGLELIEFGIRMFVLLWIII